MNTWKCKMAVIRLYARCDRFESGCSRHCLDSRQHLSSGQSRDELRGKSSKSLVVVRVSPVMVSRLYSLKIFSAMESPARYLLGRLTTDRGAGSIPYSTPYIPKLWEARSRVYHRRLLKLNTRWNRDPVRKGDWEEGRWKALERSTRFTYFLHR